MAFTGLNLPDIKDSDLNDEKQRRQILEYLYQLTEQLRFVLTNIGEENLTSELSEKIDSTEVIKGLEGSIKDAYGNIASLTRTANSLVSTVSDLSGNVTTIEQYVDSLTLAVTNGEVSSVIKLMAGGIELASKTIQFTGDIVFASDLTDGVTRISGDNILTGMISANRIDVDGLYVKYLSGASGSFTSLDAVNGLCHLGGDYIRINGVEIGYVPNAGNVCVVPTQTGGYGNVGIYDNYWQQVKAYQLVTIRAAGSSSLAANSSGIIIGGGSSRRYKKNIVELSDFETEKLYDLSPVSFEYKDAEEFWSGLQYGLIAEEVENVYPSIVTYKDGEADNVQYNQLYGPIIGCLKLQRAELDKLRARVKYLEEITA